MKKLITAFALTGLLAAPYAGLQSKKSTGILTETDHKKISQRVLGDMKKTKALKNLQTLLSLTCLSGLAVAGTAQIATPELVNNIDEDGKEVPRPKWATTSLKKIEDNKILFTKWALGVAAVSGALNIPVKLKRMNKEGYYVGWNPFKLVGSMIKFNIVDFLA